MSSTVIPNPQYTCVHGFLTTDEQITFHSTFIFCCFSFASRSKISVLLTMFVSLFIMLAPINTAMLNTMTLKQSNFFTFLFHKQRCIFSESNETDAPKCDKPNQPSITWRNIMLSARLTCKKRPFSHTKVNDWLHVCWIMRCRLNTYKGATALNTVYL